MIIYECDNQGCGKQERSLKLPQGWVCMGESRDAKGNFLGMLIWCAPCSAKKFGINDVTMIAINRHKASRRRPHINLDENGKPVWGNEPGAQKKSSATGMKLPGAPIPGALPGRPDWIPTKKKSILEDDDDIPFDFASA